MVMMSLLHLYVAITVLSRHFTFTTGQRFSLRGQSYPNHGLVSIDEIGVTDSTNDNGLSCQSDLSDCCSSANGADERGEFDFPDGSTVPILGNIRNGYYRTRSTTQIILNRRPEGTAQGLFQCRIRTVASPDAYEEFYIGVYDENSGLPTVNDVSASGLSITCMSSGGPATTVTWRRNCAVLPNNATYQQTQTVDVTQTASYRNVLVIDSAVTDRDGVYTCSVTNTRGYDSNVTGMGASYDPTLPVIVTVTPSSDSPVAGGSFTLTCDHGSTASNPTYQWFDDAGTVISTQATLTLSPLRESHGGEYSCLITDQSDGLVGCGVHRVTVQAPSVTVSVEGLTNILAGTSQNLTCSVSGMDLTAAAVLIMSVTHTWLRGSTVVQSASTSNRYTIPSGSLEVTNAGDVYTCRVAITTSYWDVSGSFGDSGSGTLTIIIPNPTILITEIPLETEYVGLNYTLRCEAQVPGSQLEDIEAVIEWMKDGIRLSSSDDGRITLGDTREESIGREFRRSIMFSPLSAGDMGSYSCSATIRPEVDNPGVTNGVGISSSNLTIAVPTLEVSINRAGVPLRILDVSPFNGFPLTCAATSRVAGTRVPIRKQITWMRSVNGGPLEPLTNGANVDSVVTVVKDDLLQATSMSMLIVNTTINGSHSYTCRAELVVVPAPENITEQNETTISVVGPSPPIEPTNLMVVDITQNSATIRWTVPSLSYDPEIYVVQYGLAMDSLTMASSMVMGDITPLNYMDDFQGSVTLTGLESLTPYYYRVMATNGGGTTLSAVDTFNTSALASEPPTMLQCSQVPSDPLSYSCNWMAPAVTNGMLTGYELECLPGLEGIPPPPVATPSMTSATISGLRNGVNYTCTVRARTVGGLSLASAPTSFYTMEIAPSGPPLDVTVPDIASREMEFAWLPPEPTRRNGYITGYSLTCFITATGMGRISDVFEPRERYRLSGFRPAKNYTCLVVAINSAGSGPPANITTKASDDIPEGPPLNITFDMLGPESVEFSWIPPSEELRNGLIIAYRVSCVAVGNQMGAAITETISVGVMVTSVMRILQGFTPATLYNCSLAARSTIDFGPYDTLVILTVPARPIMLQVTTETRSLLAVWTYPSPLEGAVIDGYRVYINGLLSRDTTYSATQNISIKGLTPFTNYTVEVSAFNTLGDGTVQEGPRSDPVIEITLGELPGSPICPRRWTTKGLSSLSIDWQPPINPNGFITSYFLELVSFDNQTVLQSGSESGSLSHSFTGFNIAAGVPYRVRVYAENINGRGSYCITTDFGDQLTPPNNILNDFSSSFDSSAILLTWTVLPLNQAKGFISLSITFGPLTFTNELEARQKRQTSNECGQSPCFILYEDGSVRISGLASNLDYFIVVVPQNEEGEIGTPTALGIPAMISELQSSTRSSSTAVIAGGSAVIAVLALLLLVAVAVIVVLLVRQRKQKYPLDYELPPSTSDRKADILTTRCEAYEVMKLQEVHQGHAHTDTGVPEQEYEEVGDAERRHGQQAAAGASQPQQETTTQQMYEEVATH